MQRLFPLSTLVLLLFAFCASLAQAQPALPAGITKGPTVEGISEYRLANGLTVLLFPDGTKPTTTVNVTYKVGSRQENYGETGMAHLLEHLVFKGTATIPSVFQELGRRGMRFNGTTSFDRTNYFETFSASDENLEWALRMEAERMTQSTFAKADLDTEMTVVRNEFEMGENEPRRVLWKRLQALAFDWHNYGNTSIGARSDVENVDIERLRAFYTTYYQPDNAVLVVAGRFDADKALAYVAKYFGAIPKPTRKLPALYTEDPVLDGERMVTVRRVGSTKLVAVLFRGVPGAHPDAVPLEAFGEIMTVEPAGRLYRALVETKKATSVESWSVFGADPGTLIFWAQVAPEDATDPARDAMLEGLAEAAKQPVTAQELDRVKAKALKSFDDAINNPQALGVALSEAIALGDWRLFFLYRDRWRNVQPADVERVAKAYIKPTNRVVGVFLPEQTPDRAPEVKRVDVEALVKDYKGDQTVAAGESFDPTPANLEARTKRLALASGMKVALLPKKTRGGTVRFSLRLHQGDEKSLFDVTPTGRLAAAMLSRGTQKRDRQAFEDELDRLRAKLAISGGETATSASGETVREHLPEVLRLAAEALRTPSFPPAELERLKREMLTGLEASRTDPDSIVQRALSRHDNPYPKGDVRYSPTLEEEVAGIARVTLEDVKRFHARFTGGNYGEIAIVGDFDADAIVALLQQLFGDWKATQPYTHVADPYRPTTPAEMRFETPDKANATILGATQVQLRDLDPDYPALAVAERILGGASESRLATRLREKEGLSYSAGSFLQPGQIDDSGSIGFYAIFAPQGLSRIREGFTAELARAVKDGFTEKEVADAKRAMIELRRTARAQDGTLAAALVSQSFLGRTFAESAAIDAAIEKTDVTAANAALRKYLTPDRIAWVFAGDFGKK